VFASHEMIAEVVAVVTNDLVGRRSSFEAGLTEVVLSQHLDASSETEMMQRVGHLQPDQVVLTTTHQHLHSESTTKNTHTHTHTRLTALFRDYPGEPVPER